MLLIPRTYCDNFSFSFSGENIRFLSGRIYHTQARLSVEVKARVRTLHVVLQPSCACKVSAVFYRQTLRIFYVRRAAFVRRMERYGARRPHKMRTNSTEICTDKHTTQRYILLYYGRIDILSQQTDDSLQQRTVCIQLTFILWPPALVLKVKRQRKQTNCKIIPTIQYDTIR